MQRRTHKTQGFNGDQFVHMSKDLKPICLEISIRDGDPIDPMDGVTESKEIRKTRMRIAKAAHCIRPAFPDQHNTVNHPDKALKGICRYMPGIAPRQWEPSINEKQAEEAANRRTAHIQEGAKNPKS